MSLVCGQCSRVNPAEASYCFYDGAALAGRASGPINAGSAPFPSQFVFPSGAACRNFDQLALACQQDWAGAVDLLKQGYLGSFFGGMGRVDLAMAAQEAAKFPDIDRGLDQLLEKLPTQAVQPPKLQAEPSEVNLGQIKINENRSTELHLTNLGMRLLYGTVTSDCKWLTLGDAPGNPEKLYQFGSDAIIPVQVRGQYLRAGTKPLEGHLVVDGNGGTVTVTFKADVPITPFAGGLFDGAVTPRKIAEKAKANPKVAAASFENGEIARWYAANGWPYPVQGPVMPGMGAIQQFFEALGVAKAPKVEFSHKALDLQGTPGQTITASIDITTPEKKVVYGWATCDQPWVEVGKTKITGKVATIPITIRIPSPAPPTLEATLHLVGNGHHRQTIPLNVTVSGGKAGVVIQREEVYESLEILDDDAPAPKPMPTFTPAPSAYTPAPPPAYAGGSPAADESPFAVSDSPSVIASSGGDGAGKTQPGMQLLIRLGLNLVPVGILFFLLLILLVRDIFSDAGKIDPEILQAGVVDSRKFIKIEFDEGRAGPNYTDSMSFAIHKLDPDGKDQPVKLNWYVNGFGNSTVLKIDDQDQVFGFAPDHGIWSGDSRTGGKNAGKYGGKSRTFISKNIFITQTVTYQPSDAVEVGKGEYKRLLNTCLVRYTIENQDASKKTHRVGLRVLMDTCIGDNDGVPFTFPGVNEIITKKMEFIDPKPRVPDFVQVLEKTSVRDPGIVVQLGLRFSDKYESPNRFQLTRYNKDFLKKWEVPLVDFIDEKNKNSDSSVVMYWDAKELKYREKRELAFTYGLGSIQASDKLGVTIGGQSFVKGELTIVGLVMDQSAKTATLKLPAGLKLIEGDLTQNVEPIRAGRPSPVTWRVRASTDGKMDISVTLDTKVTQARRVTITPSSLFN